MQPFPHMPPGPPRAGNYTHLTEAGQAHLSETPCTLLGLIVGRPGTGLALVFHDSRIGSTEDDVICTWVASGKASVTPTFNVWCRNGLHVVSEGSGFDLTVVYL